jgi:Tfp pilus assembly protein PilF
MKIDVSNSRARCVAVARRSTMYKCRDSGLRNVGLLLSLGTLVAFSSCSSRAKFPSPDSKEYKDVVSAFYVGLSALQVGDDVHAEQKLSELTQMVPGEPSGWANWGILALRQRNYEPAAQRLEKSRDLAPQNDQIYNLLGILESQRGNSSAALADFRKASDLNPQNLRAVYSLAEETERQGAANSDSEFESLMQTILRAQPGNLAALLELSRTAAKRGDADTLRSALSQLGSHSSSWPAEAQKQFSEVQAAVAGNDLRTAATQTTFLRNVLMRDPDYRHSLRIIKAAPGDEAEPFTHFLLMPTPAFKSAPADKALTFNARPLAQPAGGKWSWAGAISLGSTGAPVAAVANGREVHLASGASFPVGRQRCLRSRMELSPSILTMTSKQIWCWQAQVACTSCVRTNPRRSRT